MSQIEQALSKRIDFNSDQAMQKIVYDTLKQAILDGTIPPGSKLNINSLADTLDVSRTPIRQACKRLTSEGLIIMVPNQGATIRPIDKAMIDEIFDLYNLLTKQIFDSVLNHIRESDLDKLKKIFPASLASDNYDGSLEELVDLVNEFTDSFIAVAKQPITFQTIQQLTSYLKDFNQELKANKNQMLILLREFLSLIAYLEQNDQDQAYKLIDKQNKRLYHLAITWYDADEDHLVEEWPCVKHTCPIVSALYNFNTLEMPTSA